MNLTYPGSTCTKSTVSSAVSYCYSFALDFHFELCHLCLGFLLYSCQKLTAESEAKLLKNVPDILKNEPGHQVSLHSFTDASGLVLIYSLTVERYINTKL